MNSPVTDKPMRIVSEWMNINFRKEEFKVNYHNYLCDDSGELFTDDVLDNLNLTQVHNQYREKYGIPFTDDIIRIRKKYGVSSARISEILGFGTNTYRLYESGEMPSVSNGRMIQTIDQPEEFIKQVILSAHILSPKEVDKLIQKATAIKDLELKQNIDYQHFIKTSPYEYTGYRKVDPLKITHIIHYLDASIELYKTKLNKLLFYADFGHFKKTGYSLTGLSYRAIDLGPVPSSYDLMYSQLKEQNRIDIQQKLFENGNYGEIIKPLSVEFEHDLLDAEKNTLDRVLTTFSKLNSKEIVDLSHNETAWIENKDKKQLISYPGYAFDLKAL